MSSALLSSLAASIAPAAATKRSARVTRAATALRAAGSPFLAGSSLAVAAFPSGPSGPRRRGLACRADMNDILAQLFGGGDKLKLVSPEEAIKGRSTPIKVSNKHFITGQPMYAPFPEGTERAVFATGCFWGTEKGYWRMPGVVSTAVGYINGYTENPSYEEVCSGQTGHTEAVQVIYDPKVVSYVDLLKLYYTSHNPTQGMGQGNDWGTQYRSGIYPTDSTQRTLAEAATTAYETELVKAGVGEIKNEIVDCPQFFYAEDYHQQYLAKPGSRPYCSASPTGVAFPDYAAWAPAGCEGHAPKIPESYWGQHGPRPGCTIGFSNEQVTLSSL